MASLFAAGRAALLLLAVACRAAPRPAPRTAEHTLAARVAGCYALAFAQATDASGPWTGRLPDRVNLAARAYVQLLGPSPQFGYGQLPARPSLDSAATDYVRPAWIPLPHDSVVVFWTHVWSATVTLEARLGVSGDSLAGYVRVASDVGVKSGQSPGTRMVAQRTRCRTESNAPGT